MKRLVGYAESALRACARERLYENHGSEGLSRLTRGRAPRAPASAELSDRRGSVRAQCAEIVDIELSRLPPAVGVPPGDNAVRVHQRERKDGRGGPQKHRFGEMSADGTGNSRGEHEDEQTAEPQDERIHGEAKS